MAQTTKTKRKVFYAKSIGLASNGEQKEVKGESTWNPGKSRNKFKPHK